MSYRIPHDGKPNASLCADISAAIQLAIGEKYDRIIDLPAGLQLNWNEAARDGAFRDTNTIGDMACAFLAHRMEKLAR